MATGNGRIYQDSLKKSYNPKEIIFQLMPVNKNIFNNRKNKFKEIIRFRNDNVNQYLTSVDIEVVVRTGGIMVEFFEGFECNSL